MAFRRRFGRSRGRSSSRGNSRQVPRWTAQAVEQLLTAAIPNQAVSLYTPSTTIGAGVYEEESKLVRLVGRLSVSALDNGTVLPGPIGIGIVKTMAQFGAPVVGGLNDPLIASELATRDWLGVYNTQVPAQSGPTGFMRYIDIDTKVQRRLKASEAIMLMLMNGTGDDIVITVDIRILIVIRM